MQPLNTSLHCTSLYPIAGAAAAKLLVTEGGSTLTSHAVGLAEALAKLRCTSCLLPTAGAAVAQLFHRGRPLAVPLLAEQPRRMSLESLHHIGRA